MYACNESLYECIYRPTHLNILVSMNVFAATSDPFLWRLRPSNGFASSLMKHFTILNQLIETCGCLCCRRKFVNIIGLLISVFLANRLSVLEIRF